MNSLHKKRQHFRQNIRSKSIQQLFYRKRQQLIEQLKFNNIKNSQKYQSKQFQGKLIHASLDQWLQIFQSGQYKNSRQFFTVFHQQIELDAQEKIFILITKAKHQSLQKLELISRLINRKQFCLGTYIQNHYGWRNIIEQFLNFLHARSNERQSQSKNLPLNNQIIVSQNKSSILQLNVIICMSLIKIWQIKPKYQYFFMIPKFYQLIQEKTSSSIALTLIAELSYQKMLLPNYQFIIRILKSSINVSNEIIFFRTIQILKNFIQNFRPQSTQIHSRQIVFQYLDWIKTQIDQILIDQANFQSLPYSNIQQSNFFNTIQTNENQSYFLQVKFQTKYFLIFLLFTTLNKLFQINEKEKEHTSTKQILIMNEQLFNQKQNHTTLKFLIQEGRQSIELYHKKNILKTLSFFVSFLQISSVNQIKQEPIYETQIEEIQNAFQGTELDWFESFN